MPSGAMGGLQRRSAPCLWRRRVQLCGGATWRVWGRNRKRTPHSCRKPEQEIWFCSFFGQIETRKPGNYFECIHRYIYIYVCMSCVESYVIWHMSYVICIHVHTPQSMRHFLWFPVSWFHVPFNYFWDISKNQLVCRASRIGHVLWALPSDKWRMPN